MKNNSTENLRIEYSTYLEALKFTRSHYENFPVASLLLPKKIRNHVAIVYRFARQADDIADEGTLTVDQRISLLDDYRQHLIDSLNGKYADKFWQAFHYTVKSCNLSQKCFFDLLSAFEQDITKNRYETFDELIDYCKRSANPVGRIILEFFGISDAQAISYSDAICTGLQLTNFFQDVSIDLLKDRIYIPLSEIKKYNIDEKFFFEHEHNENLENLIKSQVARTKELFKTGEKLLPLLPRRLRFQIRLTILGGEEILKKIEKINFDVLKNRPKLSKIDYIKLVLKAAIS